MIRVQEAPFDYGAQVNAFSETAGQAGAIVTFCGIVRNNAEGTLKAMEIEHYPGMTEKALEDIVATAKARWPLTQAMVIHRFGALAPGETIMMVATASRHRVAAFEAAEFLMDFLKSRAPFWKKEITAAGADWVDAKSEDEDALKRW